MCTFYIFPRKEWFSSLKKFNLGKVLLGNDYECNVLGIGQARLKLTNGTERTLSDVRLIPKLTRNLISIGVFDSEGCVIKTVDGAIKILKGSLVLFKADKHNGLCILDGTTLLGFANTTTNSTSDDAMLWHKRLSPIGNGSFTELVNKSLLSCDVSKSDVGEDCIYGRKTRVKFNVGKHTSKKVLSYIHTNL